MQQSAAQPVPAVTPGEKQRRAASEARIEAKVTMMGARDACHILSRVLRMSRVIPRHTCLTGHPCHIWVMCRGQA